MSKLFNTLEQIRRNEDIKITDQDTPVAAAPKFRRQKRQAAGITVLVLGIIVLLYLLVPKSTSHKPEGMPTIQDRGSTAANPQKETESKTENTAPASAASQQTVTVGTATGTEQEFITLINRGTTYIEKGNYWQALYFLDKAQQMQPQRIEPLLNSVVALVELGLNELAMDYLDRVEEKDPNHPLLKENRMLLSRAGILETD